jgi:hypothetical protein
MTAPKRGATDARRGRTPIKSAQPKAAAPARPKAPTRKAAKKAAPARTRTRRAPPNRTAPQTDAVLAAQLESMAQELRQIRETRAELKDLRRLVEALTGMVEGLVANQRVQSGVPGQEVTSEAHRAPAKHADEPKTGNDQPPLEPQGSEPSGL